MIHGFIFDVYPDYKKDVMIIWLLTKQGAVSIERSYHPDFFVSSSKSNLHHLTQYLQQQPNIEHIEFKQKKIHFINWRKKGFFTYFRPPDSKSVLYLLKSVEDFERAFTIKSNGKGADNKHKLVKREKPVVSTKRIWRI